MKNKKYNGGFVGLIAILIVVAIIAIFIVRTDLLTGQKNGKNVIEQGMDDIQRAKDARSKIEQSDSEALQQESLQ